MMHFTAYFSYMEQVEHQLLRELGLGVFMDVDGARISWPRVSTECDFMQAAVFEDLLTIGIGVRRLGEKSVTYESVFCRDEKRLATGRMVVACCRFERGQAPTAVPIPEVVKAKLQTVLIADGN
jgi:YbgC/YbaW family acyl-CoA thioester hydrolase